MFVVSQRTLKTVTERCITDLTRKESYKYYSPAEISNLFICSVERRLAKFIFLGNFSKSWVIYFRWKLF